MSSARTSCPYRLRGGGSSRPCAPLTHSALGRHHTGRTGIMLAYYARERRSSARVVPEGVVCGWGWARGCANLHTVCDDDIHTKALHSRYFQTLSLVVVYTMAAGAEAAKKAIVRLRAFLLHSALRSPLVRIRQPHSLRQRVPYSKRAYWRRRAPSAFLSPFLSRRRGWLTSPLLIPCQPGIRLSFAAPSAP